MAEPTLAISGLNYSYPDGTSALSGVDLAVAEGERVAVLGPNGAGKTTLMLHLNGLLIPQSGTVTVTGDRVQKKNLPRIRQAVGLVFQDPDDQLFMPSVRQDVAFGPTNAGVRSPELDQQVAAALERVGMSAVADKHPNHLSLGQKRRVALATVLVSNPELLVLDEPSANLDPRSRRELIEFLIQLGGTQLIVTHDLPLAWQVCERSVILAQGRVVADGATADLLADKDLLAAYDLELPFGFRPESA